MASMVNKQQKMESNADGFARKIRHLQEQQPSHL